MAGVIVASVHVLVLAAVVLMPLSNNAGVLLAHIIACAAIVTHWLMNDSECILAQMEARIRACDTRDTVVHATLNRIITRPWQYHVAMATLATISLVKIMAT